jgi:hypothetical protein
MEESDSEPSSSELLMTRWLGGGFEKIRGAAGVDAVEIDDKGDDDVGVVGFVDMADVAGGVGFADGGGTGRKKSRMFLLGMDMTVIDRNLLVHNTLEVLHITI